ncbi:MAG: hypothetical protein K1X28_06865 [Parachlamydiales bacterium]|nr:hypothetical protein [Parachlamydiales bacterium]
MRFWLVFLFLANLYGQSLNIPSGTSIYYIDPSNRGKDIVNMIASLSAAPFTTGQYGNSEIAIQTRSLGVNGQPQLIRYVVSSNVWATTNSTILIVGSQQIRGSNNNLTFYVVPVEQIVEVIFSAYNTLATGSAYLTVVTTGILPIYTVNLSQRATDIVNVFSIIKSNATYFRYKAQSYFTMQTSLTGTNTPPITNGIIPYIQCVSLTPNSLCSTTGVTSFTSNGSLLYITYNSINNLTHAYYLIAGTEQVYGINYYPNP